jgi:hypothetical protein
MLLTPLFGYDYLRDAYVLRGVGKHVGPALQVDRRVHRSRPVPGDRRQRASLG